MNAITLAYCNFHSINHDDIMGHKQKLSEVEERYLNPASKKHFHLWITRCALPYWPHSTSCSDYETKNGGMNVNIKKINHDTQYLRWHWNTGHTRIRSANVHCKVKWTLLSGTVHRKQLMLTWCLIVAWDSSAGTATHYGLESPGIESGWGGETFCTHPARLAMRPNQPPIQWVRGLSRG